MFSQVMHAMCGLENFHPAGSWNGWMMTSDCIMARPPMMLIVSFCYLPLFFYKNSEPFTFMSRTMVCNNGHYGAFDVNL
jgi:hypothetical protein